MGLQDLGNRLDTISKANVFDVIECIAVLIRSEERKNVQN